MFTFTELYEDVKEREKKVKNTNKMSLKQLEAKKKERLNSQPEVMEYKQ